MNPSKQTLAERYLKAPHGNIQPLRRDKLGRLVFDDASWIDEAVIGGASCGTCDPIEWLYQERAAFELGHTHRIGRKKMHQAFRMQSREFPARVCKAYAQGFFSVSDWPKRP